MTVSLLHLGLAKTGTTYLQRKVFPASAGVNYLGKPFRSSARARLHAVSQLTRSRPLDRFSRDEAALRAHKAGDGDFEALERQLARAHCPGRLNIWSHEGFLRPTRHWLPFDRLTALQNLRAVFAAAGSRETHALIVLRDTRGLMTSYARQFFFEVAFLDFNRCSPEDVARLRSGAGADRLAALFWDIWYSYFDFAALIADARTAFGGDHVHILNHDRLTHDWQSLGALAAALHPGVALAFPPLRVNETARKPTPTGPSLRRHLAALEAVDLSRLYPENAGWLDRAADGTRAGGAGPG